MFKKGFELPQAAIESCRAEPKGLGLGPKSGASLLFFATFALAFGAPSEAAAQMTTRSMSYEECLASKAEMQEKLAVQPERVFEIVSTAGVSITRLCTDDGSVLIGCSKPGEEMVISVAPSRSALGCLWKSLVKTPT